MLAEAVALSFAEALDSGNWDAVAELLAPESLYHCRGSVLRGRKSIVESYRSIDEWVRATFEAVRYESHVTAETHDLALIDFRDRMSHGAHHLDFRCQQRVYIDGEHIVRIDHIDLPGEAQKAAAFNAACGVRRP